MKRIFYSIAILLLLTSVGGVQAQILPHSLNGSDSVASEVPAGFDMMPVSVCYIPSCDGVVLIDSVESAIHVLMRSADSMNRVGVFVTDNLFRRYDLKKIVRPVSVGVMNNHIVLLASSRTDSSYLAFFPMPTENGNDTLVPSALIPFSTNATAFRLMPERNEVFVVGSNAAGYDLYSVSIDDEMQCATLVAHQHYHVMRQSERISDSDPSGVLLTLVAVVVVFLLLTSICFIMKLFAASVLRVQRRKSYKSAQTGDASVASVSTQASGEVYAVIAAAIYAYNEDLHDDENTVITIQKVERAWTPWNAKFYNMNRYFINKR